ncbi:MAG: LysR family transcriptional regulator [Mycobacteriaceae bacterium]
MLDLHRLTVLREVKLRGGVSAAARSMSYSHSAVSQQLSQLERDVGVVLLERVGRGVRLTPAAEKLVVHTDRILEEVERATSSIARDRGEPQGTVRIAAFSTISRVVLPAALAELAAEYPRLRVVFEMGDPAAAVVQLAAKQVDLVVADSYPGSPEPTAGDITSTVIGEDPIRVYLPSHVPADLESLSRVPWAMEPATDSSAEWALRVCRDMGFEPQVQFVAPDLLFQLRLVERGLAAALLPDLVVGEADTPVQPTELFGVQPVRKIKVLTRRGSEGNPALSVVRDALETAFARHAEPRTPDRAAGLPVTQPEGSHRFRPSDLSEGE